jgi:hypothetical protein
MMNVFGIIKVNPAFRYPRLAKVVSVVSVLEVLAAFMFRVGVTRVSQCFCYVDCWSGRSTG